MTALVIIDVQRDILAVPGAARAVVGERFAKVRERLAELIGRACCPPPGDLHPA